MVNETSDSDMSSLPKSNSPMQENIERQSPSNTSQSSPMMPLTKAHYKKPERDDMSEITTSPKKTSTARNVLNFFDSPRIDTFNHNQREHSLPLNLCSINVISM